MIEESRLQKLATAYQTTKLNVVREYYQHLFLSYFYQQKQAGKIYFKGGTALRIIYRSPRFSEDLDFSTNIKSNKILEEVLELTLKEIEQEGIGVTVVEAKETSGGYLAIVRFDKTEIQLEISKRSQKESGEVMTVVSDLVPAYTIVSLKQEKLVGEKIEALLTRQKPRDFYDLYFMLRAGMVSVGQRGKLGEVLRVVEETKINFKTELELFLPNSQKAVIKDFRKTLVREVERN